MSSPRTIAFVVALAAAFAPRVSLAQDRAAAAAADALFKEGRQLHEAKRYAEACPKFAESYRLDPATGSLLALASCHEAEGKLASAWAEYNEVAERAGRDGQNDRVEIARQRASVLESLVAKIVINVVGGANVTNLVIKRDALTIGQASLGVPLPVDKGDHVIEASAPGYETFSRKITISDGATQVITIPKLAPRSEGAPVASPAAPVAAPVEPTPQPTPAPAPAPEKKTSDMSALRPIGIVAIVGGVVVAGAGAYFGISALGKNDDSNANNHCVNDLCDAEGKRIRLDARDAGNMSTGLFVVSALLLGGGITMFVLGAPKDPKAAQVVPAIGTNQGGLLLKGAF